jgi:DNA-binding transcriptional ArsR family regulator
MAELLSRIAHPERFRIIEELASGEKSVDEIVKILNISQPAVSQHLSALRSQALVIDHRRGRQVFYSLQHPWVATWLLDGLKLLEQNQNRSVDIPHAIEVARKLWKQKKTKFLT